MRLSCTIAFLCVAASIAGSAARADTAPVRHLEYHVSGHAAVSGQTESYEGTSTGMATAGYDGTMSVDILALANDGGMVVRASVTMNGEIRPEQAVTCAVYGDGRVICPADAPITGAMHVLFSHLGRNFYDPSIIDASGKWTRTDEGKELIASASFTSTPTKDPDVVLIREHSSVEPRAQIGVGFSDEVEIRYNVALSVPLSIHDVSTPDGRGGAAGVSTTDLQLTKDSFAKH